MADVVGTAYVRIKALTTGLAKEIGNDVKKAAKGADIDSSGELIGDDLAKGAGRKFKKSLEGVVGDATKNIDKKVDVDGGRRIGDRLVEGIRSGLSTIADSNIFRGIQFKIAKLLGLDEPSGRKRGRSFARGLIGAIAKFGVFFSPAILGAGSLLLQYVTALTAQIGLLTTAAVGAGAALGVVFAATGLAIIPIALAFTTQTRELKKFTKVADGVGKAWQEVGAATQETLLPGLQAALTLSKEGIPVFRGFGREIGRIAGQFAELAVAEIVGDQTRLRNILQGSARIFDSLSEVAFNFVTIFLDFFEAALPIGEEFADALERMSDRWQNLLGEAADSGRLTDVLETWYVRAVLVGGALGDVVAGIFNVLDVGGGAAVPFFQNFATWAQDFRDFTNTEAGQNKLRQIFEDALEVAHEFNGLIVDIARRIGGAVFEEGGNEGIIGFIRVLREDVVPFLDTTFRQVIEDMGPSLTAFAESFGDFLTAFHESGGLALAIELLGQFFDVLTLLLSIPGMDRFLGALLAIAAVMKVMKITGITKAFSIFAGILKVTLVPAFMALAGIMPVVGTGFVAALTPFLLAAAVIAAVVGAVVLLVIHWDKVKAAFSATVRFLKDPMSRLEALKENIENLVGVLREKLGQALGAAGRALVRFGGVIKEKLEDALGAALEAVKKLPGQIGRALLALGGIAVRALAKFGKVVFEKIIGVLKELPGILRALFVGAMQFAINALFMLVLGIPILLVKAIITFGPKIGRFLADAFGVAMRFLTQTLPSLISTVVNFFLELPGHIVSALAALGNTLLGAFSAAWDSLVSWLTETAGPSVFDFFMQLPGRIVNFLTALPGVISEAFQTAMNTATEIVRTAIDGIVDFFVKLPGRIAELVETIIEAAKGIGGAIIEGVASGLSAAVEFAGDIAGSVKDALIDMINSIIDLLNDGIPDSLGWGPAKINIPDNPIPKLARGGIFSKATLAMIGEAGKEVVIPLSSPARALELFNQSGLAAVIAKAQRGNDSAMLSSLNSTRPAAFGPVATTRRGSSGITIGQMIIEAPTPLETSRQVSDRLRILQTQLEAQ